MVLAYDLAIDGKSDAARVLLPNALYVLHDHTLAKLDSGLIWCRTCGDFQAGERIESRDEIEKLLSQASENTLPEPYQFIFNGDPRQIARFRNSLLRTLHWMSARKSPPRCLTCGGTDISNIESRLGDAFVDELGRTVSPSCVIANTGIDHDLSLYDSEGNVLGEISRICPDTNEFIDDGYDYDRIVGMLNAAARKGTSSGRD